VHELWTNENDPFSFFTIFLTSFFSETDLVIFANDAHFKASPGALLLDAQSIPRPSHQSKSSALPSPSCNNRIYFYTSGSTGEPKRIGKCLENLISEAESLEKNFGS